MLAFLALLQKANAANPAHAVWVSACMISDCDGDGVRDLLVGAMEGDGVVYIVSGKSLDVIRKIPAPEGSHGFGYAVAELGDRTGDKVAEWAVGAPGYTGIRMTLGAPPRVNAPGEVFVYDGKSFTVLERYKGAADGDGFGTCLDGGVDWDHDGKRDLLVGAPEGQSQRGGYVRILNTDAHVTGPTFAASSALPDSPEIACARFGNSACFVSDSDGDGYADIVVGAPDEGYQRKPWNEVDESRHLRGAIALLSSHKGTRITSRDGSEAQMQFGYCVVPYEAVMRSRGAEFLVGSLNWRIERLASLDATPIFRSETKRPAYMEEFAYSACVLGDLDGDGQRDIGVGMFDVLGKDWNATPILTVISGKDGSLIRMHEGTEFGTLACNLGDLDGDKVEDYCMVHCEQTLGIEAFSGKTGKLLISKRLAPPP